MNDYETVCLKISDGRRNKRVRRSYEQNECIKNM